MVYSAFIIGWGSHVLGAAILLLPVPLLMLSAYGAARRSRFQRWPLENLALLGAAMIPFVWDLAFLNHTILHSSFMGAPRGAGRGAGGGGVILRMIPAPRRRYKADDAFPYADALPARDKTPIPPPPITRGRRRGTCASRPDGSARSLRPALIRDFGCGIGTSVRALPRRATTRTASTSSNTGAAISTNTGTSRRSRRPRWRRGSN